VLLGALTLAGASACVNADEDKSGGAGGSPNAGNVGVLPIGYPGVAGTSVGGKQQADTNVAGMSGAGTAGDGADDGGSASSGAGTGGTDSTGTDTGDAGMTSAGGTDGDGCVPGGITDAPTFVSSVDLSKPIVELTGDDIRVLCVDLYVALRDVGTVFNYGQCLSDMGHKDPTCEAPASSYVAYGLRKDCAALASTCPKMLEPDPWRPAGPVPGGAFISGSVGDQEVELKSGGRLYPWPYYGIEGHYEAGVAWDSSVLLLWGSLRFKHYQGLLQVESPTSESRLICMDDVTAKFADEPWWMNVTAMMRVFDSPRLSELSCGTGGSPFEVHVDAMQIVPSYKGEGTLDGETIAVDLADNPNCGLHNCVMQLVWRGNPGRTASLVVVTDHQYTLGYGPEDIDVTIPFTSSYLLEGGGNRNVRCGGGGSISYAASFYSPDQYTHLVDKHIAFHVDSLAAPSRCPGVPIPGSLHGTDH
jgi:hypothetical protein